jgi:hypothetical protein
MTNEMNTSKVCIFCYHQLRLARDGKLINGSIKTVRINSTVKCINIDCEAVKCGYTVRGRDDNAAVAIATATAGSSYLVLGNLLASGEQKTLPPFKRRIRPNIAHQKTSTSVTTETTMESEGVNDGS